MTEAEILAEFALRTDRIWEILQWWASVTFAVMLAAHVGAGSLNRPAVVIILLLFTLFSLFVVQIVWANLSVTVAIFEAFERLGSELGPIGRYLLETDASLRGITMFACFVSTYLATVFYVLYCYLKRGPFERAGS